MTGGFNHIVNATLPMEHLLPGVSMDSNQRRRTERTIDLSSTQPVAAETDNFKNISGFETRIFSHKYLLSQKHFIMCFFGESVLQMGQTFPASSKLLLASPYCLQASCCFFLLQPVSSSRFLQGFFLHPHGFFLLLPASSGFLPASLQLLPASSCHTAASFSYFLLPPGFFLTPPGFYLLLPLSFEFLQASSCFFLLLLPVSLSFFMLLSAFL